MFKLKDWIDLALMVLGGLLGVSLFYFALPLSGFYLVNTDQPNYLVAMIISVLFGYAVRLIVGRLFNR